MARAPLTTGQVLALLAAAPARLAGATAGRSPSALATRPQPEEWSAVEVLAHLRACADVWGDAVATILAAAAPTTLRAVSPRTWVRSTDHAEQPFAASLRAFTAQRTQLLAVLEPLPPQGWARAATVVGAGRPRPRTVHQYAVRLAEHERGHLRQVERLVAAPGQDGP